MVLRSNDHLVLACVTAFVLVLWCAGSPPPVHAQSGRPGVAAGKVVLLDAHLSTVRQGYPELLGAAELREQEGHGVLHFAGGGAAAWAGLRLGDGRLDFDWLPADGVVDVAFRCAGAEEEGRERCYHLRLFRDEEIQLIRQDASGERMLAPAFPSVSTGTWIPVGIRIQRGALEVSVGGQRVIQVQDEDPLPAGSLAVALMDGREGAVRDLVVSGDVSTSPSTAAAAAGEAVSRQPGAGEPAQSPRGGGTVPAVRAGQPAGPPSQALQPRVADAALLARLARPSELRELTPELIDHLPRPAISSMEPQGIDGGVFLRVGKKLVIHGSGFSSLKEEDTIGFQSYVKGAGNGQADPSKIVAAIVPSSATPTRLEAICPELKQDAEYLVWVHVQGVGFSKPVRAYVEKVVLPPGPAPVITSVESGYPLDWITIEGKNFTLPAFVSWPDGFYRQAILVSPTRLRAQIPSGIPGGTYSINVVCNLQQSVPHELVIHDPLELNLYWEHTDDNGLALNPFWGWQLTRHWGSPDYSPDIEHLTWLRHIGGVGKANFKGLTDQIDGINMLWTAPPVKFPICGPHVNWKVPVTFTGPLLWSEWDSTDGDINIVIFPPLGAGSTDKGGGIKMEFAEGETVRGFHSSWWREFHWAVHNNETRLRNMIDGKYAIVSGKWGLDLAHSGWAEIHPVWAMAINTVHSNMTDEWAMFARNWGSQGACGPKQVRITFPHEKGTAYQRYVFRLPWNENASDVHWSYEFSGRGGVRLGLSKIKGKAVLVIFKFPDGADRPRINGTIRLTWTPAPPGRGTQAGEGEAVRVAAPPAEGQESPRAVLPASSVTALLNCMVAHPRDLKGEEELVLEDVKTRVGEDQLQPVIARWKQLKARSLEDEGRVIAVDEAGEPTGEKGGDHPFPGGKRRRATGSENQEETLAENFAVEPETDRPGGDYTHFPLPQADPRLCQEACAADARCVAFTYVAPEDRRSRAVCWLKSSVPPPRRDGRCVSGVKQQ